MKLTYRCPGCNGLLETDSSESGQTLNCPLCNLAIIVPQPKQEDPMVILSALAKLVCVGIGLWMLISFTLQGSTTKTDKPEKPAEPTLQELQASAGIPSCLRNSAWDNSVDAVERYFDKKYAEYKVLKWNQTVTKNGACAASCEMSFKNALGGWTKQGCLFACDMKGNITAVDTFNLN